MLSLRLNDARDRKKRIQSIGANLDQIDQEILRLRRQLREGGQLRAGDSLGNDRYLLLEKIGEGGFATIWKAHDNASQLQVAVKVLHANLAGSVDRRERFFRGSRRMAELQHPGVVRVIEQHGEDGGYHYFVMEYISGGNLRQAVLNKSIRSELIIPIVVRIGEALALAHSKRVIHRDVKPANILMDDQGQPLLTDFDLVGAVDTTGGTRTGALGTFLYAAPECLDRPQDADARADIYSLGMTAIFLFYGADLPSRIMRTLDQFLTQLTCPEPVKKFLALAVSMNPDDRPQNVLKFIEGIQRASRFSS